MRSPARSLSALRTSALAPLLLGACQSPEFGDPCGSAVGAAHADCVSAQRNDPKDFGDNRDVDILFVIDNSPSMAPKQRKLAENIPRFIRAIEAKHLNYHVGIVTTDVGTLPTSGRGFSTTAPGCDTVAGDDGLLQNLPCTARSLTATAQAACQTLCTDPRFVPSGSDRFIINDAGTTNVPSDYVLDPMTQKMVNRGPENAFKCLAVVGDSGCGVESPLEAARRALNGHLSQNSGFLRKNSTLALIFITDEDDCSVQAAMRDKWNDPAATDCGPNALASSPECFRIDYRCVADSIECDQSLSTPGVKTNCKPKASSHLESLDSYVQFFNSLRPQGKLVVGGIWTLPSIVKGGKVQITGLAPGTNGLSLATDQNASCVYASDPSIVGQAQHRLSRFAERFPSQVQISVCDIDNYPSALDKLGQYIGERTALCLQTPPVLTDGKPACLVGDVDASNPSVAPDVSFPVCSTACCDGVASSVSGLPDDPQVKAACAKEPTDACYCLVPSKNAQSACQGGYIGSVWRKDAVPQPKDKVVNFRCAVQ